MSLPVACEVLSLYNRGTLTTSKKAGHAEDDTSTQPYPNAGSAAKGIAEFYQTFANQRRSFLFLARANLRNANLREADLTGANLREAKYDKNTRFPEGFDPEAEGMVLLE